MEKQEQGKGCQKAYEYRQFQADMVTAMLCACYPEEYNRYDEYFKDIGNSKQPRI